VTGKDLKEYSFRVPESGTKSFFHKFPSKLLGAAKQKALQLRVKISLELIFDAKLRFALLASLRQTTFCKIRVGNRLVILYA
jgi:hypothetical protein